MLLSKSRKLGFSLVELVVVIVILGILAAIAIPRLSRGSSGAAESAVATNLTMVRSAISMYAAEHNNTFPGADEAGFVNKLTKYTDVSGDAVAAKDETHRFGPYLLTIPPCPVGENAGKATANKVLIDSAHSPPTPNAAGGEGWVYNPTTGEFLPNTATTDASGKAFNTY